MVTQFPLKSLILPPNLNNNWMTVVISRSRHVTGRTTLRLVGGRIQHLDRHACNKLVICTLMFVLSYMMWCLLYVFYIKLELYLSGGFKSITVVKASSIFYNKLALPDSLRVFYQSKGWHNWDLRWINNKYLKFQTQYVHYPLNPHLS